MAALSEHDLRVIHGDNLKAVMAGETEQDQRRDTRMSARAAIDAWSDRQFTSFAVFFLGCALAFSCLYAQAGKAFQIQLGLAVALMVLGVSGIVYCRSRIAHQKGVLSDASEGHA